MTRKQRPDRSAFDQLGDMSETERMIREARSRQVEQSAGDGRGRAGNSGRVGVDSSGRSKATYNISLAAQEIARAIAETEEVSQADIVEAALLAFGSAYEAGLVDLHPYKRHTRSLKVSWTLELPEEFQLFSDQSQL